MKMKIVITLILVLLPVAVFILPMLQQQQRPGGYTITTEKGPAFDQKVERVLIVASVEEQLGDVFAHSFEHSLVSALQENGVEAVYKLANQDKDADPSAADAIMRIDIKPLYLEQEEGAQGFIGTEFEVTVIHNATGKQVWHATGKVDYLKSKRTKRPGDTPGEGIRKEFAWHTTAAISWTFISEVNGRKPKPMYTATGGREYHGQRID